MPAGRNSGISGGSTGATRADAPTRSCGLGGTVFGAPWRIQVLTTEVAGGHEPLVKSMNGWSSWLIVVNECWLISG